MNITTYASFIFVTMLVGLITYLKTRRHKLSATQDGYFLGGRSLTAYVIAGSLLLTNLNAVNFVGMSAQAYTHNLSVIAWEVTSGAILVFVALYLVPKYLKQGITTIPEFLGSRFDQTTKILVTILFLVSYIAIMLPPVLYAGSLALIKIFDVRLLLGVSDTAAVWILVWCIGIIGSAYAIFGGLKAVAISDALNGIGLIIGGLAVPVFALIFLGDGSFLNGLDQLVTTSTEKLNSIGGISDPVPFSTLFTGMILLNLYYWGTDQAIIQRVLGAKSVVHAQKGVMLAGLFKVLTPFIIIIPGTIAFHIYGANAFKNPDMVYSTLVNDVLPKPLLGFFAAVMFGAILSTFNSTINSAATLFAIDLVKPLSRKKRTDIQIVKIGRNFSIFVAIISMTLAPFIMYAPEGLFQYTRIICGSFTVPIFTIVIVGYLTKRVPPIAAKIALILFVLVYALLQCVSIIDLNYLHQLGVLFIICVLLMLVIGYFFPQKESYVMPEKNVLDINPWKYRFVFGAFVFTIMILMYLILSPLFF